MPSKDNTLVDPSTIAVIGAVSESGTVASPAPVVPEKKAKKNKPSTSKVKKSTEKSITDTKYDNLIKNGLTASADLKLCLWPRPYSLLFNRPFHLIYALSLSTSDYSKGL